MKQSFIAQSSSNLTLLLQGNQFTKSKYLNWGKRLHWKSAFFCLRFLKINLMCSLANIHTFILFIIADSWVLFLIGNSITSCFNKKKNKITKHFLCSLLHLWCKLDELWVRFKHLSPSNIESHLWHQRSCCFSLASFVWCGVSLGPETKSSISILSAQLGKFWVV